jgi:hypothetical protein
MQTFFSDKDRFGGKIAVGIITTAILMGIAFQGYLTGRWLFSVLHHS